ncbi:Nse4 C-terminal-domain-containing protein [Cristinia sonorae]|uniref:Non-structural maintenance of chromosomes element 4 n=1 Tax=Cristinia sonorae TaxID=1940300 RepID=A0A8K0XTQ4_9AGAR|nr:Nse4 C-terminal-domain-containing protein [Cristinia sonorae]
MPVRKKVKTDQESHVMGDASYDPDQDHDQVRGLRNKYRHEELELGLDGTKERSEKTADELNETVARVNQLFNEVKGTSEAIKDSRILNIVTEQAHTKARAMKSGSGAFDVDDFIQKLVTFMGGRRAEQLDEDDDDDERENTRAAQGGPLDWESIARKALAHSHRVPVSDFMLGPLSIEQKQRAAAKRTKIEKNKADEKKPQAITEDDITRSENETTKNVVVISNLLQQHMPVNLFRFIVNPNDFGQSVENLFYLSFLIRDGTCAMTISDDGEPEIFACERPTTDEYANGLKKRQLVMELDMATWRRAVEVFDIREPLIPQRKKAETRIGNKWYG